MKPSDRPHARGPASSRRAARTTARRRGEPFGTFPTVAIVVSAVLVFAGACSSSSRSSGTNTTTSSPKGFVVSLPAGQVSVSLSGQLPPGWPSGFPLPSGATPAGSGSLGGTAQTSMVGVFSSAQSPTDVFSFYQRDAGLTVSDPGKVGTGSAFVGKMQFSGEFDGGLAVLGSGGTTYIVVGLRTPAPGTSTSTTRATGTSSAMAK